MLQTLRDFFSRLRLMVDALLANLHSISIPNSTPSSSPTATTEPRPSVSVDPEPSVSSSPAEPVPSTSPALLPTSPEPSVSTSSTEAVESESPTPSVSATEPAPVPSSSITYETSTSSPTEGYWDDCGQSPDNTCFWGLTVSTDSWIWGSLETRSDIDWFQLTPPVSGTWVFSSTVDTTAADVVGRLYDATGQLLAWDDDSNGNWNFRLEATLTAGQTYYLGVSAYSPANYYEVDSGNYYTGYALDATPPPTRVDCTPWVLSGGSVWSAAGGLSTIDASECWQLTVDTSAYWTLNSSDLPEGGDVIGELYDFYGNLLISDDDSAGNANFSLTTWLDSGVTYILKVRNFGGAATPAWTYQLQAQLTPTTPCSQVLTPGTASKLVDWELAAGTVFWSLDTPLCLELSVPQSGYWEFVSSDSYSLWSGTSADPAVDLFDAYGNWIASADDSWNGLEFDLSSWLDQGQTYYLLCCATCAASR